MEKLESRIKALELENAKLRGDTRGRQGGYKERDHEGTHQGHEGQNGSYQRGLGGRDADFAGHPDCRKSTSGYVFTFTGGAVSWISRLQKCVALSTTEAEYVAATEASKEALWLMRLVEELDIKSQVPVLHCDSQSAIMLARNPVFHAKTKHIEVKYHFIRSMLDDKSITLVKVHTDDNPADLLTKSLPAERFAYCRQMMGIG
ncbi:hypothetical protein L7F22_000375 [Adiantum nelumboides]|nr:hypothetical protein [Adiantum nelumboides]